MVIRGLRRLPPEVTYRIVGTGPDAARLRRLAVDEGVAEQVTFLGRLDAGRSGHRHHRRLWYRRRSPSPRRQLGLDGGAGRRHAGLAHCQRRDAVAGHALQLKSVSLLGGAITAVGQRRRVAGRIAHPGYRSAI